MEDKKDIEKAHYATFQSIRKVAENGDERWSARDLQPLLEYASWDKFRKVIVKAIEACRNSNQPPEDHFSQVEKMVKIGSGALRPVEDYDLSRYACYLIVQNGDLAKPVIANGQTYFAIQTRRQELADDTGFQKLKEADKRILLRNELKEHNKQLVETAQQAGVATNLDRGIRQLEAKLAAKRRIKKGLMQELLSGRRRLAGFGAELKDQDNASAIPEGWNSIKLGNVFSFLKSHAFSRDCLTTEHATPPYIYNIHYGDLHAYYTGALLDFSKERGVPILKSDPLASEKLEFLKDGDLIMADVSEDFEGVGACIELINLEQRKVTAGLHTFVRDTSGQTVEGFRGYLFKEHSVAKELRRIATGSSVHGISKTNLAKVDLTLPPIEEQQAIVRILNAADRELDALERKLTTWKAQKKYLLNNLVDGTIRLPQFI